MKSVINTASLLLLSAVFVTTPLVAEQAQPAAAQSQEVSAPVYARKLEKSAGMLSILDNILEARPQIIHLLKRLQQESLHVTTEASTRMEMVAAGQLKSASPEEEKTYVDTQRQRLMNPVREFFQGLHEQGNVLSVIIDEALVDVSSKIVLGFFAVSAEASKNYFDESVTSIEDLRNASRELVYVCACLTSELNLPKSLAAYTKEVAERRAKQAAAKAAAAKKGGK